MELTEQVEELTEHASGMEEPDVDILGVQVAKRLRDPKTELLIAQIAIAGILVLLLLGIKLLGGPAAALVKKGYEDYFAQSNGLTQVLERPVQPTTQTQPAAQTQATTQAPASDTQPASTQPSSAPKTGAQAQDLSAAIDMLAMNMPVSGWISSDFGGREDPFTGEHSTHQGLDIAAKAGSDVKAALPGTVTAVGYDPDGYGNYIVVSHTGGLSTLYGHCSKLLGKKGDQVTKDTVIAKVGSTGRSTGPHLHFEVRMNGVRLNPQWLL